MACRALVLALLCGLASTFPRSLPDLPVYVDGFKPVEGARGPSSGPANFESKSGRIATRSASPSSGFSHGGSFGGGFSDDKFASNVHGGFGAGGLGGSIGGGVPHGGAAPHGGQALGEPDKTIYVRLPQHNQVAHPAPKSAGPPQKHYRIVIIRSPTPPPVQPVIPPRTEQKTIIYVLHQKPKVSTPQVLETPVVKHPPQVLFVGYDDELSAQDLKQLAEGNHDGFTVSAQQEPVLGGDSNVGDFSGAQAHGGNFGNNFGSQGVGHGNFGGSQIQSLQPFQSGGDSFDSGVGGFSYNRRRSAPSPPGRVNKS